MSPTRALDAPEKIAWIRLARTRGIGPVGFSELLRRYSSAKAALDALPRHARRSKQDSAPPPVSAIEEELARTEAYGARIVAACEPEFPDLLRQLAPPPPILTLLGRPDIAAKPSVAIVGARNASAAGRKIARDLAAGLGGAGHIVVSGLARGIDGEAHAASLETGTTAVLGGGIDHVYPPEHDRLYAAIAAKGLIVSESAFGHRATAKDFPRRNRLITGLSLGVVVVEAAVRSGSLISARTAGEQGREVMAVPGSPLDPRAAGTNGLIKDGAALVQSVDDVLDALASPGRLGLQARKAPPFEPDDAPAEPPPDQIEAVRQALTPYALPLDEIARAAGVGASRCAAILLELELAGEATTLSGGLAHRSV